jgi:hypothetical protein
VGSAPPCRRVSRGAGRERRRDPKPNLHTETGRPKAKHTRSPVRRSRAVAHATPTHARTHARDEERVGDWVWVRTTPLRWASAGGW